MQLTPLRRWRRTPYDDRGTQEPDAPTVPVYGDHSYLTHDYGFCIEMLESQHWHIKVHICDEDVAARVADTGILQATFPRRIDALRALQTTLDTLEL